MSVTALPPDASRRADSAMRKASAIDSTACLLLAVMLWPFPIVRQVLAPVVHLLAILPGMLATSVAYHVVSAVGWRKTPGMGLTGLILSGPDNRASRMRSLGWGLVAGLSAPLRTVLPRLAHLEDRAFGFVIEADNYSSRDSL